MYKSLTKTKKYPELEAHETLKRVVSANSILKHCESSSLMTVKRNAMVLQGAHPSGKSQGNLVFLQGQGKVREFCKMVREIRKSSKVREF